MPTKWSPKTRQHQLYASGLDNAWARAGYNETPGYELKVSDSHFFYEKTEL